jgi:hypothetical protein
MNKKILPELSKKEINKKCIFLDNNQFNQVGHIISDIPSIDEPIVPSIKQVIPSGLHGNVIYDSNINNKKIFIKNFNNSKYKEFLLLNFILKNKKRTKNIIEYNNINYCEYKNKLGLRCCKNGKLDGNSKCGYHIQFCDKHNLNFSICRECKRRSKKKNKICIFYPKCKKGDNCIFVHKKNN